MSKMWTIGRRYSEVALPGHLTLLELAERNRLLSGDYVFNQELDTWICARELSEVNRVFRARKAKKIRQTIWLFLGIAALAAAADSGPALVFVGAAIWLLVVHHRIESQTAAEAE